MYRRTSISESVVLDAGSLLPADRAQHFERDEVWVVRRGQFGQADAVAEPRRDAGGRLEHQARLARAAHADERDQAMDAAQSVELRDLPFAAEEGGHLDRQGARDRQGTQWWEVPCEPGRGELVDPLGPCDVAQDVVAAIDQLRLIVELIDEQRRRDARHEDLPTVPDRQQAGHSVEGRPEEIVVARLGRPGVDGHPDSDRDTGHDLERSETALAVDGSTRGVRGIGERREHPVTRGLHHRAVMLDDGVAEGGIVALQDHRHRLAVLLPQPGAPLDVGHQERGHRHGGRVFHRRAHILKTPNRVSGIGA